ncbi:glycosyl hydrolase family 79 [Alicyclobacillus sacchari]|uniref:Glycosyl hydrolase family 79 n=1 Tax=Alicyclobacillus sacchari TaxID=392010 RepID=A0A4R8LWS5_9BACL|nr:cellulose-binding protein [Alicyclobacillus sacchari]TDY51146.1 glycosyl hydrolase family 79 [Alicyclobacillus sacchari]
MNRKQCALRLGGLAATIVALSSVAAPVIANADTTTSNASSTVRVTVNAAATLGTIPSTALGVNTAVWDGHLLDAAVPSLLRGIGATMLRFPGGSTSDEYNWQTNTVTGGYADPNNTFDNFMGVAQKAGAQPIITVNAGTGTPSEAAAWVQDANVTHHYGVKYWEIGNEMYGSWEAGNFANNPAGYAKEAVSFIQAMKAVDPSIRIGVDLIAPGTGEDDWNSTVLSTMQSLGVLPDFVIVHWYAQNPGGETDAGLLSSTSQIPTMMDTLKQQLSSYGTIPVFVTETNSVSYNPGRQSTSLVNALFLDDDMADWLEAGAQNVDWWDLHNGIVTQQDGANIDPNLYGQYNYGDYGLLSNGSSGNGISEPAANTPFPTYYGYQMLAAVMVPGATMIGAGSNNDMVAVHATKLPNGAIDVMMINKDPKQAYSVNLQAEGFAAQGPALTLFYGQGSTAVTPGKLNDLQDVTLSPYSVTDVIIPAVPGHQPQGPQFTDKTTLAASQVKPSAQETLTTTFIDTRGAVKNATLDVEIYNPSGQLVGQQVQPGVTFTPGQSSQPLTWNWTAPDSPGTYTVKAFVLSQDGTSVYAADQSAGAFTVTQPDPPTISAAVQLSATTVKVGTPVTITTTYTETAPTGYLNNGLLVQYAVYNNWASSQQSNPTASLTPGQSVTETWTFTPQQAGTYTFPEGIFTSGWQQLQWINQNVTLTVTN